jgi:hypothetical protein
MFLTTPCSERPAKKAAPLGDGGVRFDLVHFLRVFAYNPAGRCPSVDSFGRALPSCPAAWCRTRLELLRAHAVAHGEAQVLGLAVAGWCDFGTREIHTRQSAMHDWR